MAREEQKVPKKQKVVKVQDSPHPLLKKLGIDEDNIIAIGDTWVIYTND